MNKKNLIITAIILLSAVAVFYLSKNGLLSSVSAKEKKTPAEQSSAGHQGHAGQQVNDNTAAEKQAQPADKKEEAAAEPPTVEIAVDKQQMIGVKTTEVSVRPLQKIIRTVGRVEYDERRLATINTKIEGWIEKLHVDYTGRYIKKGEPLAEIYSPELIATQQEYLNTMKWFSKSEDQNLPAGRQGPKSRIGDMLSADSEKILTAARQRLKLWDITDSQIKKIEESGSPLRTFTVFSPVSGYVVQKMALQGMKVMPGEKLFDVADLSSVWIVSDIYEYELPMIREGQSASISLSYFPGKDFHAKIDYIYPALSGDTRTAKVRFTIPNQGGRLKPQMFTNVEIKLNLGRKLSIPDDAVLDTGARQIVYVDKGEGYFEPREIMLGISAEGYREVIRGLKAGEKVASSATFLIDSEAQLKNVTPLGGHKH